MNESGVGAAIEDEEKGRKRRKRWIKDRKRRDEEIGDVGWVVTVIYKFVDGCVMVEPRAQTR